MEFHRLHDGTPENAMMVYSAQPLDRDAIRLLKGS